MAANVVIGSRVTIGKDRDKATVKYIGHVQGQHGTWIGLEWDDPSRGKHDGSTGGVKYFDVSSGPTAGSFVRAEKVHAGVSLLAALRARYTNQQAEGATSATDQAVYLNTASRRKVLVELVGQEQVTERQSQTDLLTRARLVGACISFVDGAAGLQAALPNLQELDLTNNLLWRWDEPACLLAALPKLHTLNLSGNRLRLLPPGGPAPPRLEGLRALVLNGCGVGWREVCALQASLPSLRELHVAGNGISSLAIGGGGGSGAGTEKQAAAEPVLPASDGACAECDGVPPPQPLQALQSVEVLCLEDNAIFSWWEVLRLAWLPRLKRLHLSGNPIACVRYPGGAQPEAAAGACSAQTDQRQAEQQAGKRQQEAVGPGAADGEPAFRSLEALLLGGCRISRWWDVDELDKFPALKELRLSGNPLVATAKSGGRFEIIARVGGLTLLNGADVKPRERRDCELRYLQTVAADETEAVDAGLGAAAPAQHPRLEALKARYDQRDYVIAAGTCSGGAVAQHGSTLASGLCEVVLASGEGGKTSKKKLPRSTTVGAVKLLCERLFKIKAARQQLVLMGGGGSGGGCLDIGGDDTKPISFWELQPGAVLRVTEGSCDGASEAARAAAEQEALMAEQLRAGERLRVAAAVS